MDRIDERCAWQQCSKHLIANHSDRWHSSGSLAQPVCRCYAIVPAPLDSFPDCCWTLGTRHRHIAQTRLHIVWYHLCADSIYVYDMMAKHKQVSLLRTYKQLWKWRKYSFQLVLWAKRLWFLKLWRTLTRIIYEWNTWKLNLRHFQIR